MIYKPEPYIYFVEATNSSKEVILSALQDNEKAFHYLIESGYLKQAKYNYSFRFVGTISVGDKIICVLPKYYDKCDLESIDLLNDFAQIIKVLKKAGATEPSIPDYNQFSMNEDLNLSEIVIAD